MKAWVFSEEMLEPALKEWLQQVYGTSPNVTQLGMELMYDEIRQFLYSRQAGPLRVRGLDELKADHAAAQAKRDAQA